MTYEFFVDYAADKDTLDTVAGTAHVAVDSDAGEVDARLMAEQLVAAVGLEPIAVRSPGYGWVDPDDDLGWLDVSPVGVVVVDLTSVTESFDDPGPAPEVAEISSGADTEPRYDGPRCPDHHTAPRYFRYADGLTEYECTWRGCTWSELSVAD